MHLPFDPEFGLPFTGLTAPTMTFQNAPQYPAQLCTSRPWSERTIALLLPEQRKGEKAVRMKRPVSAAWSPKKSRTGGNKTLAFIHLWPHANPSFFFLSLPTEFEVVGEPDGGGGEDI